MQECRHAQRSPSPQLATIVVTQVFITIKAMSDRSGTGAAANANGSKMHFKSPLATANSASGSVSRVDHKQDHGAPPQPTLGARDALGIEAPCLESTQLDANMGGTTSISASGELQAVLAHN